MRRKRFICKEVQVPFTSGMLAYTHGSGTLRRGIALAGAINLSSYATLDAMDEGEPPASPQNPSVVSLGANADCCPTNQTGE